MRCVCLHNEILEHSDGDLELPRIAFLIHGDHAHFYSQKGARVLHKRFKVTQGTSNKERLKHIGEYKVLPPSQWERWEGDIRDGHFGVYIEDVTSIRTYPCRVGRGPVISTYIQQTALKSSSG